MPRRPNFNYERQQRERAKAAKREAKREARAARKAGLDPDAIPEVDDDGPREPSANVQLGPIDGDDSSEDE